MSSHREEFEDQMIQDGLQAAHDEWVEEQWLEHQEQEYEDWMLSRRATTMCADEHPSHRFWCQLEPGHTGAHRDSSPICTVIWEDAEHFDEVLREPTP